MLVNLFKKYSKSKFVNDMLWTVIATIIVGSSALILQTFIGYSFNADGLGIYSQIIAIYVILTAIGNFGIEYSTLKHSAEYSNNFEELCNLYSSSQLIIFFVSLFMLSIVYLIILFFPFIFSSENVADGIKFVLPGVFFFSLNKNSNSFMSGLRKIKLYSTIRGVRWLLIMVLTLVVLFLELDFNYSLIIYSIVEFILFLFFLFKNLKYTIFTYNKKWFRIHFNYGSTNVLSSIIAAFSSNLIVLISGYYLTKSETGIIAFMLTFTSIFYVLSTSIQINFNPVFAKKWADKDLSGIQDYLKKIFRFTTITSIPLFFISIGLYMVYTNYFMVYEFNNTTLKFSILAIGTIFTYVLAWPSTMLIMSGMIKQNLLRISLISFLNIVLSFLMIANFGIYGGLLTYSILSIFSIVISNYIIHRSININLNTIVKECWKKVE